MVVRCLLPIIACSALAAAAATGSAPDSPRARAARYYAAGLEQPMIQLRRGALLLQACATRLRGACSKEQRALAAHSRTIDLLDELTLFPQRPAAEPITGKMRARELRERIAATSAALLADAGDYDRQLLVRYGAVLHACPGDYDARAYRHSLDHLTAVELRKYQAVADTDYDAALAAMTAGEAQTAETLRGLSAEDCDAMLTTGQLLMELMTAKLQPWTLDDRRVANQERQFDFNAATQPRADDTPTRDVAISVAGNFITVVATELQLQVFPGTAARIKAIADQAAAAADRGAD